MQSTSHRTHLAIVIGALVITGILAAVVVFALMNRPSGEFVGVGICAPQTDSRCSGKRDGEPIGCQDGRNGFLCKCVAVACVYDGRREGDSLVVNCNDTSPTCLAPATSTTGPSTSGTTGTAATTGTAVTTGATTGTTTATRTTGSVVSNSSSTNATAATNTGTTGSTKCVVPGDVCNSLNVGSITDSNCKCQRTQGNACTCVGLQTGGDNAKCVGDSSCQSGYTCESGRCKKPVSTPPTTTPPSTGGSGAASGSPVTQVSSSARASGSTVTPPVSNYLNDMYIFLTLTIKNAADLSGQAQTDITTNDIQ